MDTPSDALGSTEKYAAERFKTTVETLYKNAKEVAEILEPLISEDSEDFENAVRNKKNLFMQLLEPLEKKAQSQVFDIVMYTLVGVLLKDDKDKD